MARMLVGYARCSTDQQDLTAQRDALAALGVKPNRIYVDHGLTGTNRARPGLREGLAETGPCPIGSSQAVVDVDPVRLHAEGSEGISLGREVLLIGRATGIPDEHSGHPATVAFMLPSSGIIPGGSSGNAPSPQVLAASGVTHGGRWHGFAPLNGTSRTTGHADDSAVPTVRPRSAS